MILSGSFQAAFDEMPGLEAIMPKEYGGKAPAFDDLWGKLKETQTL